MPALFRFRSLSSLMGFMSTTLAALRLRSSSAFWSLPLSLAITAALSCGGDDGPSGGTGGASGTSNPAGTGAGNPSGTGAGAGAGSGAGGAVNPPPPTCPEPIQPVDTSSPNAVVGSGMAGGCTESALDAALAKGGVVTFDCGPSPVTITVTSEKAIKKDTVIDGGGKVTLSGGGKTRILHLASAWDQKTPKLTVQHLGFTAGFTTDVPNTKETTKGGAAIFREGGSLDVIDCQFTDNHCASSGQDVSGGAITSQGVGDTVIVGSAFSGNSGSNGGAVGNLGDVFTVVNSSFDGNAATGEGGNPGNGGNGGAIVFDGAKTTMTLCGSVFTNNSAKAQGGAVFRVAYTDEPTTIDRCVFDKNSADATVGLAGALYLEHTVISMTATLISNNKAHYGGGFWVGQSAVANLTNVTIANNSSDQGGGLWFANDVSGTFLNCTIAGNTAGYGAALFNGKNAVKLQNCIVANNNCKNVPFSSGQTNLGFAGGEGCVGGATLGDPLLGPLQDNGGPTKTMAPGAGSPAIGKGESCPATDQRGQPRKSPCALGAMEPS
jgi:hypothetical protein